MRIVVGDSSCLCDLGKASLLDAFLKLSHDILIPNVLFEDELVVGVAEKQALVLGGIQVIDLPGDSVLRAHEAIRNRPRLSIHNGFGFALAQSHPGCVLLSADAEVATLAAAHGITVEGILWAVDQMHANQICTTASLAGALKALVDDPTVQLSRRELLTRIRRYNGEA